MCRALKVLCVAEDDASLAALKRASVGAAWELCSGATSPQEALRQLSEDRPQVVVVFGSFSDLLSTIAERHPAVRIVSDRDAPGATLATSVEDVRGLLSGLPRPGGPVVG